MDARRQLMMPVRAGAGRLALRLSCGAAGLSMVLTGCAPAPSGDGGVVDAAPSGLAAAAGRVEAAASVPADTDDGFARFRPYLAEPGVEADPASTGPTDVPGAGDGTAAPGFRPSEKADAETDAVVGGVRVFAWVPGRVYEVRTAPLRVTVLTLGPGEAVTAKAAGDTVRWQIGESTSGEGAGVRSHVMIKPLQTGLETNLVLTTSQRVYLLTLKLSLIHI